MKNIYIFSLFFVSFLTANAQSYELLSLDYVPGTIYTISANESTDQIMVGGSFNESAGVPFAKFAIMEDDEFVNPQSGLPVDDSEGIMDFAISHGVTYAGGASEDPMWRLSKRNTVNGNWESGGVSIDGDIYTLDTLSNGDLLVLGDFTTPYYGAFVYDGVTASPLVGFSIEGTPIGVTEFEGKYYINYLSAPQDYKNLFIWDETCGCESVSETNLPTNFVVYATGKSEERLYVALWNFDEGDREFYESTDGIEFNIIGNMSGEPLGITSHEDLMYFYGAIEEINGEEVNPVVTYNPNSAEWKSVSEELIPGVCRSIDFIGDDLYMAVGAWIYAYRAEAPIDTTEDTVTISVFDIEKNINIYPNPATSFITIEVENIENMFDIEMSIFNSFGEMVHIPVISSDKSKTTLDIGDLPAGVYTLKSENSQARFVKL